MTNVRLNAACKTEMLKKCNPAAFSHVKRHISDAQPQCLPFCAIANACQMTSVADNHYAERIRREYALHASAYMCGSLFCSFHPELPTQAWFPFCDVSNSEEPILKATALGLRQCGGCRLWLTHTRMRNASNRTFSFPRRRQLRKQPTNTYLTSTHMQSISF